MSDNAGMLLEWMERQYLLSSAAMLRAVSATELVKVRRHFGQTIRPAERHSFTFASPKQSVEGH
jgi:glucoamylase